MHKLLQDTFLYEKNLQCCITVKSLRLAYFGIQGGLSILKKLEIRKEIQYIAKQKS